MTAFVTDAGTARAVVFAACHSHERQSEAWLDIAIGSFVEPDFDDQVTFSCRVREDGATLFDGLVAAEGRAPFFGKKLTAEEAAQHSSLGKMWDIVDYVVTSDPTVAAAVYGSR
jgi:hypothetical protein